MTERRTKFYRDKQQGKWLGVSAGLADYTGIDLTVIRIAMVLGTVFSGGNLLLAYLIIAWMAPVRPYGLYDNAEDAKFWQGVRQSPGRSARAVHARFREIDRRLADVETYYTTRNSSLANEIEALR